MSLTIKDLITKKDSIKAKKKETMPLYVKSLDGNIIIAKPDRALVLEAQDLPDEKADVHLVYNCVVEPNLKDEELRKSFGVVAPDDIVDEIFDPGEVVSIAKELMTFAGYRDSVKVVEELKN